MPNETYVLMWLYGGLLALFVVGKDVRGRMRLALEHLRRSWEETPSETEDIRRHALAGMGWGLMLVGVFLAGPLSIVLLVVGACAVIAYRWCSGVLIKFVGNVRLIWKGLVGR